MNTVFKIFLSMSFSGGLLILVLFFGKWFWEDKISRQWQYYVWLIVIMRLLFPFGTGINLMGKIYQAVDQAVTRTVSSSRQQAPSDISEEFNTFFSGLEQENDKVDIQADGMRTSHPLRDIWSLLTTHIWLVWLMISLSILIRKLTVYQSFVRYVNAGATPVSDVEALDRFSIIVEKMGIRRPVELWNHPLISTPLLIGVFRPSIVLPETDISEKDFQYIALHELTHCKRLDMFYKWLVQITVCLHWFNPLVYLMGREIGRMCEFSCDEAVLAEAGYDNAQDYGKTLLDAMAAVGKYRETPGAVTLSENKRLLKERLGAIMRVGKKSRTVRFLTGVCTLCIILGACFVGVYPAAAYSDSKSSTEAEKFYEAGSLPGFEIAFSKLEEEEQRAWLDRIYADGRISFFSVSVNRLRSGSPLIQRFAKKIYDDHAVSFFSVLAGRMDEQTLEEWLDIALEDQQTAFESVLYKKLDRDDELDALEEELAARQKEEYQCHGVTVNGKEYYYEGQLVNIFLDIRKEGSFYVLDMNPAGTVNIKIVRGVDEQIVDVVYMTEEEVIEMFGVYNEE